MQFFLVLCLDFLSLCHCSPPMWIIKECLYSFQFWQYWLHAPLLSEMQHCSLYVTLRRGDSCHVQSCTHIESQPSCPHTQIMKTMYSQLYMVTYMASSHKGQPAWLSPQAAYREKPQPHQSWSPQGTGMETPLTHPFLAYNLIPCHSGTYKPPTGVSQNWPTQTILCQC